MRDGIAGLMKKHKVEVLKEKLLYQKAGFTVNGETMKRKYLALYRIFSYHSPYSWN